MQTGTEHPNATLVREGMGAFSRGDFEAYGATLADDIVWHQIGAPTLNGKDEMRENNAGPGRWLEHHHRDP